MTDRGGAASIMAEQGDDIEALASVIRAFAQGQGIALSEAFKWGQPSFAPPVRMGTPVRVGEHGGRPALFVHCQSPVMARFREVVPDAVIDKQRAFMPAGPHDPAIAIFLGIAFRYKARTRAAQT